MHRAWPASLMEYELGLRASGYRAVAGLDEVGRGALAGPIVAAAVVLPDDVRLSAYPWNLIRDSKTVPPPLRSELAIDIRELSVCCEVSQIESSLIDQIGIGAANRLAMEFALRAVEPEVSPDFLLIDAMTIDASTPQFGIIDGDAISLSIAAASIVAKVHRDQIMTSLAGRWPQYGWDRNKGYGVARHVEALRIVGPCKHHRFSFRPVRDTWLIRDA